METLFMALASACLAYLISEINVLQKSMQSVLIKIAVLESLLPKRRDDNRPM